jgi:hypothetical protein
LGVTVRGKQSIADRKRVLGTLPYGNLPDERVLFSCGVVPRPRPPCLTGRRPWAQERRPFSEVGIFEASKMAPEHLQEGDMELKLEAAVSRVLASRPGACVSDTALLAKVVAEEVPGLDLSFIQHIVTEAIIKRGTARGRGSQSL